MVYQRMILLCFLWFTLPLQAADAHDDVSDNPQLAVWVNEAIVATYTFNYKNYLTRQTEIAVYFTAKGWMAYSSALIASKLPEAVKKNAYDVNAVATMPPSIKIIGNNNWRAIMPLLVVYKNPQYQQKQTLEVTMEFTTAPSGQGVRGLSITSMQSKLIKPPCQCPVEGSTASDDTSSTGTTTKMP